MAALVTSRRKWKGCTASQPASTDCHFHFIVQQHLLIGQHCRWLTFVCPVLCTSFSFLHHSFLDCSLNLVIVFSFKQRCIALITSKADCVTDHYHHHLQKHQSLTSILLSPSNLILHSIFFTQPKPNLAKRVLNRQPFNVCFLKKNLRICNLCAPDCMLAMHQGGCVRELMRGNVDD